MKTAYIFHDAFCDPFSDWYGWMKTTMEGMGYLVVLPTFPTPAGQSYESWKAVIKNYLAVFDRETVFIGHGTGGVFALRLLEETPVKINGLFLVASYAEQIGHIGYDRVNDTFVNHEFDWKKIKDHIMMAEVFAGADDPFVPVEISQRLAGNLGESLQMIPDGGHINKASGFVQATAVAQGIKESLTSLTKTISTIEPLQTEPIIQKPSGLASGIDFTNGESATTIPIAPAPQSPVPSGSATLSVGKEVAPAKETAPKAPTPAPIKAHTMYGDMSSLVNSNKGTIASSLLTHARTDEKIKKAAAPSSPKNILYIVGTIITLLVAAGIFGYIVNKSNSKVRLISQQKIQSVVQADAHQKVDIGDAEPYVLEKSIRTALATPIIDGTILDIYYTKGAARAPFSLVLANLEIGTVPKPLSAEFGKSVFMHGVGKFSGTASHFLVIPISDYDVAFANMQEWESTMFRDLGIFMDVPDSFLKTQFNKTTFGPETISNQNLRVLRYHKPADITLDEPVPLPTADATTSATSTTASKTATNTTTTSVTPRTPTSPSSALVTSAGTTTASSDATSEINFISEAVESAIAQNPFVNIVAPYQENDLMLAYFFLNEKTLIITDSTAIIPQILARYAGSQIYQ